MGRFCIFAIVDNPSNGHQMEPLISTTITYEGKDYHIVVSQPAYGGDKYNIHSNNYYKGAVIKYKDGWTVVIDNPCPELSSDDRGVILEAVINKEGE